MRVAQADMNGLASLYARGLVDGMLLTARVGDIEVVAACNGRSREYRVRARINTDRQLTLLRGELAAFLDEVPEGGSLALEGAIGLHFALADVA